MNNDGQLGDGTTERRLTPVAVAGLSSGLAALAAKGQHSCVAASDGGTWCWGRNANGQLGDGTKTMRLTPVAVVP